MWCFDFFFKFQVEELFWAYASYLLSVNTLLSIDCTCDITPWYQCLRSPVPPTYLFDIFFNCLCLNLGDSSFLFAIVTGGTQSEVKFKLGLPLITLGKLLLSVLWHGPQKTTINHVSYLTTDLDHWLPHPFT